jgi:hypothetical protein
MTRPNLATRLASAAGAPPKPSFTPEPERAVIRAEIGSGPRVVARARQDKTMIAGYFTPDLARAVKLLAVERGMTVQAVIGEGLDEVLRIHGKHPMGER